MHESPNRAAEGAGLDPDLIPPDPLIREHSGGVDADRFVSMGDEIVRQSLVGGARLLRSHRVLDLGCGCGKLARALTTYLTAEGRYDGLDITREVIDWCAARYRKYPNFHFHFADVRSERYNPQGALTASTLEFPFSPDTFDVVFLSSVFTHMLPADVDHYLSEIARVMKRGGVCLATFFVLDKESRRNIEAGLTSPAFGYDFASGDCRIDVPTLPEAAIAYDERFVRALHHKHRLTVERIAFGEWGRGRLIPQWQDEVWSRKPISA